jgi:hypothetical protein
MRERFQHIGLLRLGLIAAPPAFYKTLCPPQGFRAATFPEWLAQEAVQQAKASQVNWGQITCYGGPSKEINVEANADFLERHDEFFDAMVLNTETYADACDAIGTFDTPLFGNTTTLSSLLFTGACSYLFPPLLLPHPLTLSHSCSFPPLPGDLALDGLIPAPSAREFGDRVGELKLGAQTALISLGLLPPAPTPRQTSDAFVRFFDVLNHPDPLVSGISVELREVCCLFSLFLCFSQLTFLPPVGPPRRQH